jgi:hypothetical protein
VPPRRRTTMKDVAKHAGVSISTVSYVLNDSGPVAPERRSRVLDAVQVLEYSPNESAQPQAALGLIRGCNSGVPPGSLKGAPASDDPTARV